MKTNTILTPLVGVAFALALASCGEEASTPTEASAEAPSGAYPLKVCVVSGEDLGSMGKPHIIVHEGTTVQLCCKSCVEDFDKDPATYVAKLKAPAGEKEAP